MNKVTSWWLRPAPLARVAVLRPLVYLYLILDVFTRTSQVLPQSYGSSSLYDPVDVLSLVHQPAPQPWLTQTLRIVIIVGALVAATGALPRLAGYVVALAFSDWACLAMSHGKVDHDHLAVLVALWVLPSVGVARWRDPEVSQAAGWSLRCVELAVVATYNLSTYAKVVRYGHPHWLTGATFAWALVRRGHPWTHPLLHHPLLLVAAQVGLFGLELCSPVMLALGRRGRIVGTAVLLSFHVITWLSIGINFAPLMVCLAVFLPLEDIGRTARTRAAPLRSAARRGGDGALASQS